MFRILCFVLLNLNSQVWAQNDAQQLQDWTKENEKKLQDKYPMIESDWFEQQCLLLAVKLEFKKTSQCKLFKSDNINAYVFDNGHVYFSLAMLKLFTNKHQWASVLAHENAHIELQHYLKMLKKIQNPDVFFPKRKIKKMLKKHEQEADNWAQQKLLEFDMDPSQVSYFLKRVSKLNKAKNSKTHHKINKRIGHKLGLEIIDDEFISAINNIRE
jgi:hypothetical protein